jgi:hypothetical protein
MRTAELFLGASIAVLSCFAQQTGEITGRVVYASGSVTPGATVEIQQVGTNSKWELRSSSKNA